MKILVLMMIINTFLFSDINIRTVDTNIKVKKETLTDITIKKDKRLLKCIDNNIDEKFLHSLEKEFIENTKKDDKNILKYRKSINNFTNNSITSLILSKDAICKDETIEYSKYYTKFVKSFPKNEKTDAEILQELISLKFHYVLYNLVPSFIFVPR